MRRVWAPARAQALREAEALQATIAAEGGNFELKAWDWRYYAEKRRKALYDVDQSEVRPYLPLEGMIAAAFDVAHRLFGVSFVARDDVPLPNADARAWTALGPDGAPIALFIGDYFARDFEAQRRLDERAARPAEARRPRPADRRQRDEFRPRRRRRAVPAQPRRGAHVCSTSSATPCTACCRTSRIRCSPARTSRATSSSCRRNCSSIGWSGPRRCAVSPAIIAPASRCPRR